MALRNLDLQSLCVIQVRRGLRRLVRIQRARKVPGLGEFVASEGGDKGVQDSRSHDDVVGVGRCRFGRAVEGPQALTLQEVSGRGVGRIWKFGRQLLCPLQRRLVAPIRIQGTRQPHRAAARKAGSTSEAATASYSAIAAS